jgi:hypothetical protein
MGGFWPWRELKHGKSISSTIQLNVLYNFALIKTYSKEMKKFTEEGRKKIESRYRPHEKSCALVSEAYSGRVQLIERQKLGNSKNILAKCSCETEFRAALSDLIRGVAACPACSKTRSNQEKNLADYIQSLGFNVECNRRFDGIEFDIFCPEKMVAFEFHGLFWHAEKEGKSNSRHALKYAIAKAHGIRLLQIYSDEWEIRADAVKTLIKGALGIVETANARSTKLIRLDNKASAEFMNAHHVQGTANAMASYGLSMNNEVIAVMQFATAYSRRGTSKSSGVYELARFASTKRIRGGASKLMKAFITDFAPKGLISYVDHRFFDGGMYSKLGFVQAGKPAVDYEYLFQKKRWHKSSFKKSSMRKRFGDIFPDDWTERQMADHIGAVRLWNAGRTTYVWGSVNSVATEADLPMLDEVEIRRAHYQRGLTTAEKLSASSKRRWECADFRKKMTGLKTATKNVERIRSKYRNENTGWWFHEKHGLVHAWHGDLLSQYGGDKASYNSSFKESSRTHNGWRWVGNTKDEGLSTIQEIEQRKAADDAKKAEKLARSLAAKERSRAALERKKKKEHKKQERKEAAEQRKALHERKAQERLLRRPAICAGDVFGELTVTGIGEKVIFKSGGTQRKWWVKCSCGTEKQIAHSSLKSGLTKSCGCIKAKSSIENLKKAHALAEKNGSYNRLNILGQKFGRLTVIAFAGSTRKGTLWDCICDCGKPVQAKGALLNHGSIKSCGCLIREQSSKNGKLRAGSVLLERRKAADEKYLGLRVRNFLFTSVLRSPGLKVVAKCDCGGEKVANPRDIIQGKILRCSKFCTTGTSMFAK